MAVTEGIVLYNRERDGCYNGVYTNNHPKVNGKIYNEILRKKEDDNEVPGIYDCFYFDLNNERCNAEVEIKSGPGKVLEFTWKEIGGPIIFRGIGYQMNAHQIAVHYWD